MVIDLVCLGFSFVALMVVLAFSWGCACHGRKLLDTTSEKVVD